MKKYTVYGEEFVPKFSLPIKGKIKRKNLTKIDLSKSNKDLAEAQSKLDFDLSNFVQKRIDKKGAKGAYGGYLENRNLYESSLVFSENKKYRNIHLGIDFWFPPGTKVCAPLPGRVHSYNDNSSILDYGPTVILEHVLGNEQFYSLYGHLSRASLNGLKKGKMIMRGEVFATLGTPIENVGWPPHLHFQIIYDLEGHKGDYPGVCFKKDIEKYKKNCPDPIKFFGRFRDLLAQS